MSNGVVEANFLAQHLADGFGDAQIGRAIGGGGLHIDDHQMPPPEIADEPRRRVDHQAGAPDDEGVGLADGRDGSRHGLLVQAFRVQHHVGLDDAPAGGATGHAGAFGDEIHIVELAAADAVVAQGAAVQLVHRFGTRRLVQPVDVLGDDGPEFPFPLELRQPQMGRVGLCPADDQLVPVKAVELLGVPLPEGMAEDGLGRVIVLLMVQPVHAAEIRDARLGADPGPAEKDDVFAFCDDGFQCLDHKDLPFLLCVVSVWMV